MLVLISAAALLTSEGEDHMLCFLLVYIVCLTCVHAVTIAGLFVFISIFISNV